MACSNNDCPCNMNDTVVWQFDNSECWIYNIIKQKVKSIKKIIIMLYNYMYGIEMIGRVHEHDKENWNSLVSFFER